MHISSKRRYTRRALLSATGQLLIGSLLGACSAVPGTAAPTGSPGTSAPTVPTPVPATPTPKPSATPVLKGEVVVAVATGSYKGWQAAAEAYTKLHPYVQVIVDLQRGSIRERDLFYRAQLASGSPRMSLATINTLGDLFAQQAFMNWNPHLESVNPYTGTVWREVFLPGSLDAGRYSAAQQFMLSTELFQILFFYNRDLLRTLGLDPDQPPRTFDDLAVWAAAASERIAGFDVRESTDQLDWLARIYGDAWYTTREYWQMCVCQEGDVCYDDTKPAFPSADWRSNVHFDDPQYVDFNRSRAWEALDAGYFLGESDTRFDGLAAALQSVFQPASLPIDWRIPQQEPLLFYTSRALMYLSGSYFIASCGRAVQELQSRGRLGALPEGRETPTPDPLLMRTKGFELGAFPCPPMASSEIDVQYQRTIEQPAGYWGIPRKIEGQNALEVDFTMFITSPAIVALRLQAELDRENAEGNIIGIPTVMNVTLDGAWEPLFAHLHAQGNSQKPHPLQMAVGGLPSSANQRRALWADYLDGTIDAAALKAGLRTLRQADAADEQIL